MNNNSLMLGHFLPSALLESSTPLRRLTSTSSDSGDSGVDPSYRQDRKIFVGGVPSSVGPEELAHFFQSYGQVEEAFIIYDRYSGRHRGFGFVTFTDMVTTKSVCSTRIFNLHGRKIECKRALKREDILAHHEVDTHDYKSFRPNNVDPCPPSPSYNCLPSNMPMCPTSYPICYDQYRQSSPNLLNHLAGTWIINPTFQNLPPLFHPVFNAQQQQQQQFTVFSVPTMMWNPPYQQGTMASPYLHVGSFE